MKLKDKPETVSIKPPISRPIGAAPNSLDSSWIVERHSPKK